MGNPSARSPSCDKEGELTSVLRTRTKHVTYCSNIYAFRSRCKGSSSSVKKTISAPARLNLNSPNDPSYSRLETHTPRNIPMSNAKHSIGKSNSRKNSSRSCSEQGSTVTRNTPITNKIYSIRNTNSRRNSSRSYSQHGSSLRGLTPITNATYSIKTSNSRKNSSRSYSQHGSKSSGKTPVTNATYSIDNANSYKNSSRSIVPSLGLKSDDSVEPDESDGFGRTFSGLRQKPGSAYQNWLSAKRGKIAQERQRRIAEEKKLKDEEKERRAMAEEVYQAWLERKRKEDAEKARLKKKLEEKNNKKDRKVTQEEKEARIRMWLLKKALELEKQRQITMRENLEKLHQEQERQEMAKIAFAKWVATADGKPKPVPLNQGILSLRGTVSAIYMNPNEWQFVH